VKQEPQERLFTPIQAHRIWLRSLGCGCLGYRKLEKTRLESNQFRYDTECLFDENASPLGPYAVDWKYALDVATQDRN
jgi:hypothetical protein